jgi:signal transduction histidine kinase
MRTSTVAALLRLSAIQPDDGGGWLEELLRIDSETLGADRVSYWSIREAPSRIFCELCYVAPSGLFERGAVLREGTSPVYFGELRKLQMIDAADVRQDTRTRDLGSYLDMQNIGALLDAPVVTQRGLEGILCHEQIGGRHAWTTSDQEFALATSQALVAKLEARARSRSQMAERRAVFLSDVGPVLAETAEFEEVAALAVRRALPILGEAASLVAYDDGTLRCRAVAHVTPDGQRVLDDWKRRYSPGLEGLAYMSQAIRSGKSLICPVIGPEATAASAGPGTAELVRALNARSVMAVPLQFRGKLTGAVSFLSDRRIYGQDDLALAESYARQISGILENRRLHQRAEEALQMRDEFVSMASHELRTPITALRASAEAIVRQAARHPAPTDAIVQMAKIVGRQSEQLGRLSERILAASQIVGGLTLRPERVDLAELVRGVARSLVGRAEQSGSRLVVHAETPAVGQWDPARLEQAVSNLLENAIRFGDGKPIEATISSQDERALLSVRDHGIGISEAHLGALFQRYNRVVSGRNFGGLGLGLHVVKTIVEAHGGNVRAESAPGEGSTFVVELPIAEHPAPS